MPRLADAASNELLNIATIFLMVTVGTQLTSERVFDLDTVVIFGLGLAAFSCGTIGGLIFAKLMNLFLREKLNPLIGSAGVSAVPMAARISHQIGQESNPGQLPAVPRDGPERRRSHRIGRRGWGVPDARASRRRRGVRVVVLLEATMADTLRVKVNDQWYTVEAVDVDSEPAVVLVDGERVEVSLERAADPVPAHRRSPRRTASPSQPRRPPAPAPAAAPSAGGRAFTSPMPGIVLSLAVGVGDQVTTGDDICVLEAMKMQQTLKADWSGVVSAVHVIPGQQVQDGDAIVELE